MRRQGLVVKWNAERGFGFIRERDSQVDVFAHVSAFPRTSRAPVVGDAVSFEIDTGADGRKQARAIAYDLAPGRSDFTLAPIDRRPPVREPASYPRAPGPRRPHASRTSASPWRWLVLVGLLGGGAWLWRHGHLDRPIASLTAMLPSSSEAPPSDRTLPLQHDDAPVYACDGRQHCSQMRSCEEARWMLSNCSGMQMDGDMDGKPCEDRCGH